MTISKKWAIGIGVLLASIMIFGCYEFVREREARVKAETVASTNDKVIAANQQAMAARDKADAAQQVQAQKTAALVTTTPQAVKIITQYVPVVNATAGSQAQAVTVQKTDLSTQAQAQLPAAPSYAVMTQDQAVATAKKLIQCDADQKSLAACDADRSALKDSLAKENATAEQYKTALKGGTFWQRLKSDAIKIGIAGVIGAAAGYAAHR